MRILKLDSVKLPRINDRYNKNFSIKTSYRDAKAFLVWSLKQQSEGLPAVNPPYSVLIHVETHYDIDSFLKGIFDAMQDAKVIDNDKNILHIDIYKKAVKRNEPNKIIVELYHHEG